MPLRFSRARRGRNRRHIQINRAFTYAGAAALDRVAAQKLDAARGRVEKKLAHHYRPIAQFLSRLAIRELMNSGGALNTAASFHSRISSENKPPSGPRHTRAKEHNPTTLSLPVTRALEQAVHRALIVRRAFSAPSPAHTAGGWRVEPRLLSIAHL